jgi:hypothetical protein
MTLVDCRIAKAVRAAAERVAAEGRPIPSPKSQSDTCENAMAIGRIVSRLQHLGKIEKIFNGFDQQVGFCRKTVEVAALQRDICGAINFARV